MIMNILNKIKTLYIEFFPEDIYYENIDLILLFFRFKISTNFIVSNI